MYYCTIVQTKYVRQTSDGTQPIINVDLGGTHPMFEVHTLSGPR